MEADFDMNDNRIINVAEPVADTDAARLIDVREAVLGSIDVVEPGIIWAHDYAEDDGNGAMWTRAIAAGVAASAAADEPVVIKALAGDYEIDWAGAYSTLSQSLLGYEGAGDVHIVCDNGYINFRVAPRVPTSGTISYTAGSDVVTGVDTVFLTDLDNGYRLLTPDGEFIGEVDDDSPSNAITNNTTLRLKSAAIISGTNQSFRYASTNKAVMGFMGGCNSYLHNVELDGTFTATNFALRYQDSGDMKGGNIRLRGRSLRVLDDCGTFDIDTIEGYDIVSHGVTGGSSGSDFGSIQGGRIGRIYMENMWKSGFNWSNVLCHGMLLIGEIDARWTRWATEGIAYPSSYAACRIGNGSSNILINRIYGEGVNRVCRLTDTDNVWVNHVDGRDAFGPFILFNSKDQISRNSGVLHVTGVGPNRGNGLVELVDEDGESIANPNEEACVVAEGSNWTLGLVNISSDEYLKGLGDYVLASGSAVLTNRDYSYRGSDFSAFDPVTAGDLLFDENEGIVGRVLSFGTKVYWVDSDEDTSQASATVLGVRADHATMTLTLDANAYRATPLKTSTITTTATVAGVSGSPAATRFDTELIVGSELYTSAGVYIGRVFTITDLDTLTLEAGAAVTYSGAYRAYNPPRATGTIICNTGNTSVSGTGTLFETELDVGTNIYTTAGVYVGRIASITDNNTANLVDNAIVNPNGAFNIGRTYYQRTMDDYFFRAMTVSTSIAASGTALTGVGTDFVNQLAIGDYIFDNAGQFVGEIESITSTTAAVLTAPAARAISPATGALFGRPKKTARGVEIAETALNTNIDLGGVYVRGAAQQYRLNDPRSLKVVPEETITVEQLATLDAAERNGQEWDVTNGNGSGRFRSDGEDWARVFVTRLRRDSSTTSSFALDYRDNQPNLQLHGALAAGTTANITLPTGDIPDGAIFTISCTTAVLGTWNVNSGLVYISGGQAATVIFDKTSGVSGSWRLLMTGGAADRPARIRRSTNAPESNVAGNIGDICIHLSGVAGAQAFLKETGNGTTTGWVPLVTTSGGANVAFPAGSAAAPSVHFAGDTNTGMWSPAADTIAWSEGGVESMRLTSAGRMGVGTTAPEEKLHVNGTGAVTTLGQLDTNIRLSTDTGTAGAGNEVSFRGTSAAAENVATYAAISSPVTANSASGSTGYISFSTKLNQTDATLTERLRITEGGLVGIGTAAAGTSKVHIYTGASTATVNTGADELLLEGSGTAGLSILTPDSTGVCNIFFGHNNDNDAGRIVYTHNGDTLGVFTNGTQALWVNSTQQLGIGATPGAQVDISHTTGGVLRLSRNDTGLADGEVLGKIEFYTNDTDDTSVRATITAQKDDGVGSRAATSLVFSTGNNTAGNLTEKFRITPDGVQRSITFTVATLPTSVAGARAFVTDASGPTFGAAVVGGGAVGVPVYHDGASWKVG